MPTPRATNPDYKVMHMRLRRDKGPASLRACVECGSSASDWAYDGLDPNEKVSEKGLRYSQDLDHYRPMCRSCHLTGDKDGKCRQGHEFTPENTYRYGERVYCRKCRAKAARAFRERRDMRNLRER